MKFSLNADGAMSAGQGLGNMFKAMAMGGMYRSKAEDEALLNGAKMNAYRASATSSEATAERNRAAAALDQQQLSFQQDPLSNAMLSLGLPTGLAPAFKQRLETGSFGPSYDAPSDALGGGPKQPDPATPETVQKLGQALSIAQRMMATGSKVNQGTDAALDEQRMRGIDAVMANPALAGAFGKANAAAGGKPLFDNVQDTGYSLDNFTGAQTSANPTLAKLFDASSRALTNQRNAAAGNSSASADLDKLKLTILQNTGSLPGSGEAGEGALSSTVIRSLDVPVLDKNGKPVSDMYGKTLTQTDKDALKSFYAWTTGNNKKPTAAQFAAWESAGRPGAGAAPTEANKNPAPGAAQPTIKEVPEKKNRQINTVYETPKGPLKWTGTGWVPAPAK